MKRQCAWCKKEMGESPLADEMGEHEITHGICEDCANNILFQQGASLSLFLNSLTEPVLLLDESGAVQMPNRAAVKHLGLAEDAFANKQPGQIFECQHARFPPGCGKTIHCSGCTIRMAIKKTMETGRGVVRLPATLHQDSADVRLLISTEKVGAVVLLRIEELAPK